LLRIRREAARGGGNRTSTAQRRRQILRGNHAPDKDIGIRTNEQL